MRPRRTLAVIGSALAALRSNPFHVLLSTLGLVIGVAALVAILALGDGLERYAREQVSETTSLETITVAPRTTERVDGIALARRRVAHLSVAEAEALADALADTPGLRADVALRRRARVAVRLAGDTARAGAYLEVVQPTLARWLRSDPAESRRLEALLRSPEPLAVLSRPLAARLAGAAEPAALVGDTVLVAGRAARVAAVLEAPGGPPALYAAFGSWAEGVGAAGPPTLLLRAHAVERVPDIAEAVGAWLDRHVTGGRAGFDVVTARARVAQVQRGVLLFKVVMGLITGIAVLVGGIGVMNVLLISVTERTREIGVRRAAGARRRDVVAQFLAEAVAVALAGGAVGLGLGLAGVAAAVPAIQAWTDVPFGAAFSWGSLGVVLAVAVAVGVGFGTYPAWRAARLSPADAIRHE